MKHDPPHTFTAAQVEALLEQARQTLLQQLGVRTIEDALRAVQGQKTRTKPDRRGLIRKKDVADRIGVSIWTVENYVRAGILPRPIYSTPGSPAMWRASDIEAFLKKQRRSRRPRPALRGAAARQSERRESP